MTRPDGLICTAIKRDGRPCCYKKIRGYEVCGRHGAARPPSPPPATRECPVCYEVKPARVLTCRHSLCKDCHRQWFANNTTCPMCRAVVIPDTLRHRVYMGIYGAVLGINDVQMNDRFASEFLAIVDELRDLRPARRRLFD